MKLNNIQKLTFEFEEILEIEDVGLVECVDIEVQDDKSFTLSSGIISHNSAMAGISKVLGNKEFDYYALKGKPLNSYEVDARKLSSNVELSELFNILDSNCEIQDKEDGKFYEIEVDGKTYIINENDSIKIGDEYFDFKDLNL